MILHTFTLFKKGMNIFYLFCNKKDIFHCKRNFSNGVSMNKPLFWKLGLSAILALGLSACSSSSSSSADDDEDIGYSSTEKDSGKSSSSKKSASCKSVTANLAVPTNLEVVKNGDNKWVLIWDYSANDERPETGFVIESLDMSDSLPNWKKVGTTNEAVVMYNLSGESKAGKYYRVSAMDDCGVSKATDMVEVTATGANSTTSADLAVPTNLKLENVGDNMWQLSWSYTNNENRPEQGFKLQSLNLDDKSPKWTDDGSTNKGVHVVKIDGNKKGGLLFHVAAKDNNGVSEYSEEITIPRVVDSTSTSTNNSMDLAVPTDLKLDSIGVNKYKLSWSYTDNTNRPENGFKLQSLNLNDKTPKWAVMDSTNKGVNMIVVDATKNGGKYIRVAAKDSKGTSAYSSEILVPVPDTTKVAGQEIDLAVPVNLTLNSLGNNEYLLSWSYTDADKRPAKEFVMQKLYLANGKSWENVKATINKDVLFYKLDADTVDYFIRIAAKDDKGLSAYSNVVQVPKKGAGADIKNPPTNLAISRIAPSVWELSWNYENNVENANRKFIIQSSKLKDFKWVDIGQKLDGNVRNYYIQGRDKIETYYRMAVINDGDTSAFTEAIQLTPEIPYRDYMALNVPEMTSRFTMVFTTLFEADQDTSTKEDRTFTEGIATYTIMNNLISKYIFESEYTKDVHYEARWFTSLEKFNYYKGTCDGMKKSDKCDSCFWEESFPYEEPSISKRISWGDASDEKLSKNIYDSCATETGYEKANHFKLYDPNTDPDEWATIMNAEYDMHFCVQDYARKICEYYVQLRIVWTDINDETDWSEWSKPFNVREINGAKAFCEDN